METQQTRHINYKLTENEIIELVNDKNLNYPEETIKDIYRRLDSDQKGFVMRDDLIDYLENDNNNKNFEELNYNLSKTFLLSKSELILIKLKRIRKKIQDDEEMLEDINWIIKAINHQTDLYEPDLAERCETDDIKAIKQYSKYEINQSTRNDLKKIQDLGKAESVNGNKNKDTRKKSVPSISNKKAR